MNDPLELVIDASVGVQLFLVEALSGQADAIFSQLALDPPARLYVPDLFYVECANTLWKYARRFGYPPESAQQDISALVGLALQAIPTSALAEEALEIAVAYQTTAYDACYVALGRRLGLPLVTADKVLVQRFAGTSYDVRWLGDFPSAL